MEVERGSFHWKDKDYAVIEVKEKQEAVNTNGDVSHQKKYDFVKQFRLNDISFSIEKVRIKPSRSNPGRREKNQVEFLFSCCGASQYLQVETRKHAVIPIG